MCQACLVGTGSLALPSILTGVPVLDIREFGWIFAQIQDNLCEAWCVKYILLD